MLVLRLGSWRSRIVWLALVAAVAGWQGCATQGAPVGGPKDIRGPQLLRAEPAPESVGIRPKEVVFTFDEFLRSTAVEKGVFISPPPLGKRPQVYVQGKTLRVRLDAERLEARTYVITLGPGIKDNNEGNPLPLTLQYAFTPGSLLDTCSLAGRVVHPLTSKPAIGYLVALFDADSVARHGLWSLDPIMAAQTDSGGYFQISYLRPGRYVAFGFFDKDASFTWNQLGEAVAQDPDSLATIVAGGAERGYSLFAFQPDTIAPKLRRVETLNARTIRIELSEPVVSGMITVNADTFRLEEGDGLHFPSGDYSRPQLFLTRAVTDSFTVRTSGLTDTVGNMQRPDTTLGIKLKRGGKFAKRLEVVPGGIRRDPFEVALLFSSRVAQDSAERYIQVLDTALKPISKVGIRAQGARVIVRLPADHNPEIKLRLVVDTLLYSQDSLRLDRRGRFDLAYPRPEQFGSFSLTMNSAVPKLLIRLTNVDKATEVWTTTDRRVRFPYLPPGRYRVSVIEDADGNRRWTPGRVSPKRLSETVYHYTGTVLIRGGWDQELTLTYPEPEAATD